MQPIPPRARAAARRHTRRGPAHARPPPPHPALNPPPHTHAAVLVRRDFDMRLMPALEAHAGGDSTLLHAICAGFTAKSGGLMNGCIGAPDGCHLEIRKPPLVKPRESVVAAVVAATKRRKITKVRPGGRMPGQGVVNPRFYYNYKGFFSINLQAVADAQRCAHSLSSSSPHPTTPPHPASYPPLGASSTGRSCRRAARPTRRRGRARASATGLRPTPFLPGTTSWRTR